MLACYCVANGLPFLGIPTTQGKVVYLNFELLEGECRARFFEIQKAIGNGDINNIEVIQLRDRTLSDLHLFQLQSIVANSAFCLCAFDPVYKLLNGRDERVGVDIAPVLASIASIAGNHKCSVGFSAHFAKGNQAQKFAIDRISGSNYFARDADVILVMTELNAQDCYGVEIIQRSFPDIKSFGIRWKTPLFIRDDSLDATDIRQPGREKKTDELKQRMLAALHASDYEGGLSFTEFLKAAQIDNPKGKPTPSKATFARKLNELTGQKCVLKSVATGKYILSPQYVEQRRIFLDQNAEEVS
jgi:hypothetical protein